jgi:hypothetical protein
VTNCAKALSIGVDEFIVSLDPTMAAIGRSFYSMFMSPSNSMIPSSSSSSSLDSISSRICHGSANMWPNLARCDPYHVSQ